MRPEPHWSRTPRRHFGKHVFPAHQSRAAPTEEVCTPACRTLRCQPSDLDAVVHPPLINLVSTFVDQGVAHWQLPTRNDGLLHSFRALHASSLVDPAGLGGLKKRLKAQLSLDGGAIVLQALHELGVNEEEAEHFITAELLALPGWAGMVRKLENEPILAEHQHVPCTLMDYLAVRLTLLVVALRNAAGDTTSWRTLSATEERASLSNELLLFDAAQLLGLSSQVIRASTKPPSIVCSWSSRPSPTLERRRIWHLAYERRHERLNLLPLAKHHTLPPVAPVRVRYRADVFFCIDEREESVRRALEEVAPDVRTFGAAGFFGCAMHYSGNDDKHSVDLCPVVVKPAHFVSEQVHGDHQEVNNKRQGLRRSWAAFAYGHNAGSRNIIRGWIGSVVTGSRPWCRWFCALSVRSHGSS